MAESSVVLNQQNKFGLDTQVKLVDGRQLQVINKGKKISQQYAVDILSLKGKSKKIFCFAWKWLFAGISFFLIMLLLLKFLPAFLSTNKNLYLGIILLAGLIGSIFSLIQFLRNTSRKQIFYSRNAHVPIITLCVGKPNKKIFTAFISKLEKRIKQFGEHMDLAEDKQLTGEMKMLRRLCDSGVISKKEYEKAKAKLFSGFGNNAS